MKNKPLDWVPPYRAYDLQVAAPAVTVAVLGAQAPSREQARVAAAHLGRTVAGAPGLLSAEDCTVLTERDVAHAVVTTYWATREDFGQWWASAEVQDLVETYLHGPVGVFCEVFTSPTDHLEVNSSTPDADWGIGRHHPWQEDDRIGYWGASRDRIDAAEDDGVPGEDLGWPETAPESGIGRTVVVTPPANAAFIRTVQGWTGADAEQREFFLEGPYRAYLAGVRDLQENGAEHRCLSARLLSQAEVSPQRPVRETQAWFASMADLEAWVWHSPTHGQIMKTFGTFAARFGVDIQLLLSHEVFVVPAGSARCTYVNCAEPTGLSAFAQVEVTGV